jgi:hypothetical protein
MKHAVSNAHALLFGLAVAVLGGLAVLFSDSREAGFGLGLLFLFAAYPLGVRLQGIAPGMDLLTGVVDPSLPAAPAAAIVAERFTGPYVAVAGGVSVLGEQPLEGVEASSEGLRLTSAGLVRVVSQGMLDVSWNGPQPPDVAPDKPEFLPWLLEGDAPGIATLREPGRPTVTYIRSKPPFTLRRR